MSKNPNLIWLLFRITAITFFSCPLFTALLAQNDIQINVTINPPYPPFVHEYTKLGDKVITTLTNTTNTTRQVYLHGLFTNDNDFIAQTVEQYIPDEPIIIGPHAVYQIAGNDQGYIFFNDQNISVNYGENTLPEIIEGGFLPEGNYRLCITAYDYLSHEKISNTEAGCGMFHIEHLNSPILISPNCSDNSTVLKTVPQNIPFSWTPVIPSDPNIQIKYNLFIVPITNDDNPQDKIETGINTNANNLIKIPNIQNSFFNYTNNNVFLESSKYAWAVKAYVVNNTYPIENSGLSNVCSFMYQENNIDLEDGGNNAQINPNIDCSCKTEPPANTTGVSSSEVSNIHQIHTSSHTMDVLSLTEENGLFSGTGTINLPILANTLVKVKVAFSQIGIGKKDGQYYQTSGNIIAMQSNEAASMIPSYDPLNPGQLSFSPGQTESLSTYFQQYTQQLLSEIKKAPNTIGYKLPLGIDEGAMKIAIINMVFSPNQSYFDAASVIDIIDGNTKVALSGTGICMNQSDLCGQAKLYLAEDFNIPAIGIKLNGGKANDPTYILFSKDGFEKLRISATYTFPDGTLIKQGTNLPASVSLTAETDKGWSDWIAEVSFTPFHISGFDDFVFGPDKQNTKMYYDHSDTKNPNGIPSPYRSTDPNDQPIQTDLMTWRGFYIPAIDLTLPAALTNVNKTPIVVSAQKLIFDGGISGSVSVNNILNINDGSLDGWYFSIDQFKIDFWKNTFKSSSLNGKIVLPLSKNPVASNQLDYSCTLSKAANSNLQFGFVISPKDGVSFDVLWAKSHLGSGTIIEITKKANDGFKASATLCGTLDITAQIDPIPDINLVAIKFQNLKFHSEAPYFVPGEVNATFFGLASPQHSLAGFVIDLNPEEGRGISFYAERDQIGLNFNALLKLVADVDFVPRANIDFKIYGNIKFNGIRPQWDGAGAGINKISLGADASIGSIKVKGDIAYFNKNGAYGFMGSMYMEIADLFGVSAKAVFGYQKQGDFNFFFIDAMVDLGATGFSIPPCMAIYGFKGGVYYNMSMPKGSDLTVNNLKTSSYDPDQDPMTSLSGVKYYPEKGEFSISAGVLFGFTQRNLLDADGSLTISFNSATGGVKSVYFRLVGRVITDYSDPISKKNQECMGYAIVQMKMNFDEGSFLFQAHVELGAPNHSSTALFHASATVNFFAGPTGWFIHIGRPWSGGDPNQAKDAITLSVLDGKVTFKGYFQCGNGTGRILRDDGSEDPSNSVDPMPPIPDFIMDILSRARGGVDGENGHANSLSNIDYARTPIPDGGLAFGANFNAHFDQTFLIFYINVQFMAGFDIGFYKLKTPVYCENNGNKTAFGSNNFYAKGQAYIGASIDLGIDIDLFFYKGKISIVNAGIAAYVQLGAPNPTYCKGEVGGYFSVLGGLISGGFSFSFYWGDECNVVIDEKIPLISDVYPKAEYEIDAKTKLVTNKRADVKELQPIYVTPSVAFNYMVDHIFLIVHDEAGLEKKQYFYYRIDPSDVKMNIYGGGIKKEVEGSAQSQVVNAINMKDFILSPDQFSYSLNNSFLFNPDRDFNMDVEAKVKLLKISNAWFYDNIIGGQTSGYKKDVNIPFGLPAWSYAKTLDGKDFVDFRYLKFTTDCGIKYITEDMVSDAIPTHRSQNNPLAKSPTFSATRLRKDSYYSNDETPKFFNITAPAMPELSFETTKAFLDASMICAPEEFKNGQLMFKINSFRKGGYNGYTFSTKYINAQITNSSKKASVILDELLPENSFIVVQMILKAPEKNQNAMENTSQFQKNVTIKTNKMEVLYINTRTLSLANKLAPKSDEIKIFEWYFNTGKYNTYQDKMADITIKMDTSTQIWNSMKISKSAFKEYKLKSKITKYTFKGSEKFDEHDLRNYSLKESFEGARINKYYPAQVASGMLGHAFDRQSQSMVDSFLNTYFVSDMKQYERTFVELIHQDLQEQTSWDIVTTHQENVLPFMNSLPLSLGVKMVSDDTQKSSNKYTPSVMPRKDFLTSPMLFDLFSLEKISVVYDVKKSSDHIIPSVILTMKDIKNYKPGVVFIQDLDKLSDAFLNYSTLLKPNIINGYQPNFLNQKGN